MEERQLPEEFKEFVRCLNSYDVKYLLIGGWCVTWSNILFPNRRPLKPGGKLTSIALSNAH